MARGSDVRLAVRVGRSRQCANVVPEEWPSRIVRRPAGDTLQNPAYRPADAYNHEGSGVNAPDPSPFCKEYPAVRPGHLALRAPYPGIIGGNSTGWSGRGVVLSRTLLSIRAISGVRALTALAATVFVVAGCAGANNATSNQGGQSYQTSYGLSSTGTTTSLYTELFGPAKPAPPPATATAAAEPVQGAGASAAPQPAPPAAVASTSRQTRAATASATPRQISTQVQPSPPPVEVAQQPVAPQPPPEQDVPVAYGITANGPTTDLYTELFGPRRSNGQ
jgi:hypothetical protein